MGGYFFNPMLEFGFQKKQEIKILMTDADGNEVDITDFIANLSSEVNKKLNIAQGSAKANQVVITDENGSITTINGVVMNQAERNKLQAITNPIIFKGVKNSYESLLTVENPQIGWLYIVKTEESGDNQYKEYVYVENRWECLGAIFDITYTNPNPTTKAVGGIAVGSTFQNKTIQEMFDALLYPYIAISGLSLTTNISGAKEKGVTLTITKVKPNYTRGSVAVNSYKLYSNSNYTNEIASNNTGGEISGLNITSGVVYARISDETTTLSASFAINYVDPIFWGIADKNETPTSSQIVGLTKVIEAKGNKTYNFTTVGKQHPIFAYPASYGNLKSILDSNGYEYIDDFQKYTINVAVASGTVSYNVYIQKKEVILNAFSFTFKF
jgi:hypothetical protein